jgi:integrase
MLVNEWAETAWNVLNVRPKTLHDYKRLYKRHLAPVIGLMSLDDVDSVVLQQKLISLPPQTARHCLMLVKTLYREARIYKISTANPAEGLRTAPIQVADKKFLPWEDVDALDWGRYNEQIRFLALHGLRWSEAAALREMDIRDGFVFIHKTVNGPCKSKSSVRKVPYLGHFKQLPLSYKPLQQCANKHGVTVHSFRRTYAYLLKTQGIHVTTAQKLLGHSDPLMTLKVYTSVLDSEIDDAGHKLLNFVSPIGNKSESAGVFNLRMAKATT